MAKLVDKVLSLIGIEEVPEDEEELFKEEPPVENSSSSTNKKKKNAVNSGAVLSLHAQRQLKVIVIEPKSFDEVQSIADHLKSHRPVIINLEQAGSDLARHVINFISGVTYALNGSIQKVGNGIFLSVPDNIGISNELLGAEAEKGSLFSWLQVPRSYKE